MGWFSNWINEQTYIAFGTYYYEALLYKGKVQVGRVVQALSYSPIFIVDFDRKLAFFIEARRGFIKGHKIILHYNIDNAIPLLPREETIVEEVNNNLTKTNTKNSLIIDRGHPPPRINAGSVDLFPRTPCAESTIPSRDIIFL